MTDDVRGATLLLEGQRLPLELAAKMEMVETGGSVALPHHLFLMKLADLGPEDLERFRGTAEFRLGLVRNFMLLSVVMEGLNFDFVWSPFIAAANGEPLVPTPEAEIHLNYNFVLLDRGNVVRGLRVATVSPAVSQAIAKAQRQLLQTCESPAALEAEMRSLFERYPVSIPDSFFHETCKLGD